MTMTRRLMTAAAAALSALLLGAPPGYGIPPKASARPAPVEPGAGAWKSWVAPQDDTRMQTPPPPGPKATKEEVAEVLSLQAGRGEGALAAIRYWDSGSPSYRWNEIAFKAATESSSGVVTERMLALLNVAIYDATVAAWRAKYRYDRRRPVEVETRLAPAVPDPESPSYPSEHAAAAGAAAGVLSYLFPDKAKFLADKAEECGESRLLAGVQYKPGAAQVGEVARDLRQALPKRLDEEADADLA